MLSSILFAAVGVVGAGYSVIVSAVAINRGPECVIFKNGSDTVWDYPFSNGWDANITRLVIVYYVVIFLNTILQPNLSMSR